MFLTVSRRFSQLDVTSSQPRLRALKSGVLTMYAGALDMGSMYGTTTYPVTYKVLEIVSETFSLFMLVITTFYAGKPGSTCRTT